MRCFKEVSVDQIGDDLRTINLVDYLRDVLTNLGPQLRATPHKILLDCPGAVTLTTRPGALTQIVTNLVMNSLTHAFPAGRAGTLDLSAWRDGEDVVITYGDDGVGVPPAIMSRLFEPGFTTRRGQGGTGLGLGIVHDLVTRALGGTMTARNRPHGGLAIDIRLPADSPR
jgi:signal transduction histidine kinase